MNSTHTEKLRCGVLIHHDGRDVRSTHREGSCRSGASGAVWFSAHRSDNRERDRLISGNKEKMDERSEGKLHT